MQSHFSIIHPRLIYLATHQIRDSMPQASGKALLRVLGLLLLWDFGWSGAVWPSPDGPVPALLPGESDREIRVRWPDERFVATLPLEYWLPGIYYGAFKELIAVIQPRRSEAKPR